MFLGTNQSINRNLCAALNSSLAQWQVDAAVEMIAQSLGADFAALSLFNAAGEIVLTAHRGLSERFLATVRLVRPGDFDYTKDLQGARPSFQTDLENSTHLPPEIVTIEGAKALATSPLRYCGLTLGVAAAGWRRSLPNPLQTSDLAIFEVVGSMLGTAAAASQLHKLGQSQLYGQGIMERRRSFFEETTDAVLMCDPVRQIVVEANAAAARITGYAARELEGMPLTQLWPPDSVRSILAHGSKQDPGYKSYPIELRLLTRNGTSAIVDATMRVALQDGTAGMIELVMEDVTQQKRAQELTSLRIRDVIRALEDERKRLAWQLHEETIQSLLQVSRQLQDLGANKSYRLANDARTALNECADLINATSQQVRELCHNLRPLILDDLGLVAGLKWLTRSMNEKGGPAVTFEVTGEERRLAADTELALFRVTQEALANARKHAGAARVHVSLLFEAALVTARVADDGRGFEPPPRLLDLAKEGRMGLLSIQDRAQIVGGSVGIRAHPGKGTELTISIPCATLTQQAMNADANQTG